jgi:UDP-N-acetyl-D-glucosamine dehydrogenase
MAKSFDQRVQQHDLTVAVIGLGYVGLPLAVSFAEAGFVALGFDVHSGVVANLNKSVSHIADVPSERIAQVAQAKRFSATTNPKDLSSADVIFICVPTPFDKTQTPDLSYIQSATETVTSVLRSEMLIILQSTTYPGTTTEFVKPILEKNGLQAGKDFYLAFSPERVDPGNETWHVRNTPKVVGGFTSECVRRSALLLASLMEDPNLVHSVGSPAVAEMAKLLENTYRAVNIALVNELAQMCHKMDIDVWEVIDAAATKPFGFQPFYPGIGPGGHCIPVDPHYLAWKAREYEFQLRFVELAADVNTQMAEYAVSRLQDLLNNESKSLRGSNILCFGAAFKPGVSDVRNSRAIRIMEMLAERGASVAYSDLLVDELTISNTVLRSVSVEQINQTNWDAAMVLVNAKDLPLQQLSAKGIPIFDAVNAGGPPSGSRTRL